MRENIRFQVIYEQRIYQICTFEGEYLNLMMLIKDQINVFDYGDCGGLGRCGTCLIDSAKTRQEIEGFDRNEAITLQKMGITDKHIRLSCQIPISTKLEGVVLEVLEAE